MKTHWKNGKGKTIRKCRGWDVPLCNECARHTKQDVGIIHDLKEWPSGRLTCLKFIQRG